MILLDTHALIWLVADSPELGRTARSAIAQDQDRRISAVSFWEVAMLVDKERLVLKMPLDRWAAHLRERLHLQELSVTGAIAIDAGTLSGEIHGDPADRMIIATARHHRAVLVTADRAILPFARAGHVRAIDARV